MTGHSWKVTKQRLYDLINIHALMPWFALCFTVSNFRTLSAVDPIGKEPIAMKQHSVTPNILEESAERRHDETRPLPFQSAKSSTWQPVAAWCHVDWVLDALWTLWKCLWNSNPASKFYIIWNVKTIHEQLCRISEYCIFVCGRLINKFVVLLSWIVLLTTILKYCVLM